MKGVALESSPYGVHGDAKTMIKHQTLLQEYHDLHEDVEASRKKLENMKQRKATLLVEVSFLRRRYKYLLRSKAGNLPQEQGKELEQPHDVKHKGKNSRKAVVPNKKEATPRTLPPVFKQDQKRHALPPVFKPDQKTNTLPLLFKPDQKKHALPPLFKPDQKKRKTYKGPEASLSIVSSSSGQNHTEKQHSGKNATHSNPIPYPKPKGRLYKVKEGGHQSPMPSIDLNQQERIYYGNGSAMGDPSPVFNLNHKDYAFSGKQPSVQNRAPVFDLNQISREEEELQENSEPLRFEELKKDLISEDQLNDLKLSVCRNLGDGSSRVPKRKISWQDPVALRV